MVIDLKICYHVDGRPDAQGADWRTHTALLSHAFPWQCKLMHASSKYKFLVEVNESLRWLWFRLLISKDAPVKFRSCEVITHEHRRPLCIWGCTRWNTLAVLAVWSCINAVCKVITWVWHWLKVCDLLCGGSTYAFSMVYDNAQYRQMLILESLSPILYFLIFLHAFLWILDAFSWLEMFLIFFRCMILFWGGCPPHRRN